MTETPLVFSSVFHDLKRCEGKRHTSTPRHLAYAGLLHSLLILLFMVCCRDSALFHSLGDVVYMWSSLNIWVLF